MANMHQPPPIILIPWRFFVGESVLPLMWRMHTASADSRYHNATFRHGATEEYRNKPYKKLPGPGWHRGAPRIALILGPILILGLYIPTGLSLIIHSIRDTPPPSWTHWPWIQVAIGWETLAVIGAITLYLWRLGEWMNTHEVRDNVIDPVSETVADMLRWPYNPHEQIVITPNQYEFDADAEYELPEDDEHLGEAPVKIVLKKRRNPKEIAAMVEVVAPMLGMPGGSHRTRYSGREGYVEIFHKVLPTKFAGFDDIKPHLEGATQDRIFAGVLAGGAPVYVDLVGDAPHVLVSAATSKGKSALLRLLLAQRYRSGAYTMVLDFKGISHLLWLWGLPGVCYAYEIPHITSCVMDLGREMMRRKGVYIEAMKRVALGEITIDQLPVFDKVDVLIEEGNSLIAEIEKAWTGKATLNPVVTILQQLTFMGRGLGIHVWWLGQRAEATMFGPRGGSVRENFMGARFLSKPSKRTFAMLVDDHPYERWPGGGPGVWWLAKDDGLHTIRAGYLTDAEAREWADSGVEHAPIGDIIDSGEVSAGRPQPVVEGVPQEDRIRSIKQLQPVLDQISPISFYGLQKAIRRARADDDPTLPEVADTIGSGTTAAMLFSEQGMIRWWAATKKVALENDLPRWGYIYALYARNPDTGREELAYIGQTRDLRKRLAGHEEEQPWWDLYTRYEILHKGMFRDHQLDTLEQTETDQRKPVYPWQGQEVDAPHHTPKYVAEQEREARDVRHLQLVPSPK